MTGRATRLNSILTAGLLTLALAGCASTEVAEAPPAAPPPAPAPPPPVLAAEPSAEIGDVVVTARRREESVQSVPSAITVLSSEQLTRGPAAKGGVARSAVQGMIAPRPYPRPMPMPEQRERYDGKDVASIMSVADAPVSTFSVDVDTGAYSNARRFLNAGQLPPADAVRTEEMINYFRYDYAKPADRDTPFTVTTDLATTPWNLNSRLLRIGIRGYDLPRAERPAANLVFLVDVSGSMNSPDKLPLVQAALSMVADKVTARDRVSIVVYAGAAGVVLEPTSDPAKIRAALSQLQAGGSTAGGAGIQLAYATARAHRIAGGINRVILATDGDFNVGVSSTKELEELVKRQRDDGITLTTLGFGEGNYNESAMERIADVGNGNYAYIDSATEAQKVLDDELASTLFTIAKDVKIQVEFNPAQVSEYRLIGYENRALAEEDFDNDKVDAGDIGAGHQVTAIYEIVPRGAKGWLPDRRYEGNRPAAEAGVAKSGELAFVKLRYKAPTGDVSKLIERPVPASLIASARPPSGDMAFAVAVAAFGQRLRGDKYLGNYGFADIRALAGSQTNFWRQEFIRLTSLAEARSGGGSPAAGR